MPSDTLPSLLASMAEALRANDLETARNRLDEVEAVYEEIDLPERRVQRKATIGRDSTETPTDVRKRLDKYAQAVNASDLARSSMLTTATVYLADPTQRDVDDIANTLEEQAEHEATLVELESNVSDDLEAVDLPASLLVKTVETPTGPRPKGSAFEATVGVENIGDTAAKTVTMTVDSEATVSPTSVDFGDLNEGTRKDAVLEVDAETAGEFTLTLQADGDPGGADETTERFRVVDKATGIDTARGSIADLIDRIDDSNELTGGRENATISKLESADAKLADAERFLDKENSRQADEMLETATHILGAFLNQVDSLTDGANGNGNGRGDAKAPSESFVRTLTTVGEGIIDQIALAREAAP